jgi:hypothetical protein
MLYGHIGHPAAREQGMMLDRPLLPDRSSVSALAILHHSRVAPRPSVYRYLFCLQITTENEGRNCCARSYWDFPTERKRHAIFPSIAYSCAWKPCVEAALRDIRLGMQTPGEAALHCYRAIERVKRSFSTDTDDRIQAWGRLREALNLDRTWLDTYTAHATALRHGEIVELDLEHRNRCFAQAVTVVIRYAAYLKGGNQTLPAATFPVLT